MVRDSKLFLEDIIECIAKITKYLAGKTKENLVQDQLLQDAVLRRLEIIGEASSQLPGAIKSAHPEVPWRDMVNMRNVFVHGYFGVDIDLVWKELHEDLNKLRVQVEDILQSYD